MKARFILVFSAIIFYTSPMERSNAGTGFYQPEDLVELYHPSDLPSTSPTFASDDPIQSFPSPKALASYLLKYVETLSSEQQRQLIVSLDIDDTLGKIDDPRLQDGPYGLNTIIALTIVPHFAHMNPYNRVFRDHVKLMRESHMVPLDKDNTMGVLVQTLFKYGALPLGNTSRSDHYHEITQRHLEKLGIDFERTVNTFVKDGLAKDESIMYIPFKTEPPSSFRSGILYCCGTNPKSERLKEFLTHLNLENPLIVHVDDRRSHLERMHEKFPKALLLHLASETHTDKFFQSGDLAKILATPPDQLTEQENRAYKKFRPLNIKAEDSQRMLYALYDKLLPFPKATSITAPSIDRMITNLFGKEAYTKERQSIIKILLACQQGIQKSTPLFKFITDTNRDTQSLAIYLAQQDPKTSTLVTNADGMPIYTFPVLVPTTLLYESNLTLLQKMDAQRDHHYSSTVPVERSVSYLDLSRSSPPGSPGPSSSCTPVPHPFSREHKTP